MYLIVDNRKGVAEAYQAGFHHEGIAALGIHPEGFTDWIETVAPSELEAVEGFVIGETDCCDIFLGLIRKRAHAPVLALLDQKDLETTLHLLREGVDDVVRKPVHVREIVARTNAIWRRINTASEIADFGRLKVFFDGRDAEIDGAPFELPRRERRILEYLVRNAHRRVTKTQVFNAVYGLFEDVVDEVVVEGHISKLRKKLRRRLGHDVVDAKRYLGYQFTGSHDPVDAVPEDTDRIDIIPALDLQAVA